MDKCQVIAKRFNKEVECDANPDKVVITIKNAYNETITIV